MEAWTNLGSTSEEIESLVDLELERLLSRQLKDCEGSSVSQSRFRRSTAPTHVSVVLKARGSEIGTHLYGVSSPLATNGHSSWNTGSETCVASSSAANARHRFVNVLIARILDFVTSGNASSDTQSSSGSSTSYIPSRQYF